MNYKSCGVDLYPAKINDNNHCILCAGCLKSCSRFKSETVSDRPNPQIERIGFASDLFQLRPMNWPEMIFVLFVSGFVISEIWLEWRVTSGLIWYLPDLISKEFLVNNSFFAGLIRGILIFGLIPLMIWILPYGIYRLWLKELTIKEYLLNYGIAFIPIIAAAHLCKAILKTTSRMPYFKYVHEDITGMRVAENIIRGDIVLNHNPQWVDTIISIVLTALMIIGILLSLKIIQKLNRKKAPGNPGIIMNLIPLTYGFVFLLMIIFWRWLA
jgi:hypothetical protein